MSEPNTSFLAAKTHYSLLPHVHVCRTDDHVVLLDLKRDEYLGIDASDSKVLSRHIVGWPEFADGIDASAYELSSPPELLNQMVEAGMLSTDRKARSTPLLETIEPAERSLVDGFQPARVEISIRDVLLFSKAAVIAHWLLKGCCVERAVMRAQKRRSTLLNKQGGPSATADLRYERDRVAVFRRLRPFLSVASDACLFNSFSLSEFLSFHGIFPRWVFGVSTRPFAAHCWLQRGAVVLNDTPEHVRGFTPIMVI